MVLIPLALHISVNFLWGKLFHTPKQVLLKLEDASGWFLLNGVLVSNTQCVVPT